MGTTTARTKGPLEFDRSAADVIVTRLRRAEGQLRGVIGMLEEGRDCDAVITQLAAVSRALDRAGFKLIASGLKQCLKPSAGSGSDAEEERLERLFLSLA